MDKSEIFEVPFIYTGGEYLYTCGEVSRFFREVVENKRLLGTKCPQCGKVWMPPRAHCPDCYALTDWVPLTGRGTIVSCTYCYFPGARGDLIRYLDLPYVQALIKLDGAYSYLLHGVAVKEQKMGEVQAGTRVKVVFREDRKGTMADFYFVAEEDTQDARP